MVDIILEILMVGIVLMIETITTAIVLIRSFIAICALLLLEFWPIFLIAAITIGVSKT